MTRADPYAITLSARPLRAAFVVSVDDCPDALLDDLFAANYRAWGGRLRPIVPSENGLINPLYRRLLEGADPDVVYTYCDLAHETITWIDQRIQPWSFLRHRDRARDGGVPDYRPQYLFTSVESAAVLQRLRRVWGFPQPPTVVTARTTSDWPHRRWFERNFGLRRAEPVLGDPIAEWPRLVIENDWSDERVLREMAVLLRMATMACASAAESKFFRPRTSAHNGEYCLIVGDTSSDWLMAWNQVFTLAPYQWDQWHTLCVGRDQLVSPGFIDAVQRFLRQHAHGSGGPATLSIRSTSVPADDLREIARRVSHQVNIFTSTESLPPWSIRAVDAAETDTFPVLELLWPGERGNSIEQQAVSDRVVLQKPPSDVQLSGEWVLDVDVEYQASEKFYINEQLWWRLPKRIALPHLFMRAQGRINRQRSLSYAMGRGNTPELTIPSEESVLRLAIEDPRQGHLQDRDQRSTTDGYYRDVRPSDKGRYAMGVIDLFGGLHGASQFFGSSFWRGVVEHICHRTAQSEAAALAPIVNKLHKNRARLLNSLQSGDVDWLASYVLSQARNEPTHEIDVTWTWLEERFVLQRRRYLANHPDYLQGVPQERTTIQPTGRSLEEQEAANDLRRSLQQHVEAGVFFQGVRYRCRSCGLAFWRSISGAAPRVECDGCGSSVATRVESEWVYRLNTLVRNAVAFHGVIPVVWTLASLRWGGRTSFLYSPGVALFRNWDDNTADAELDVACIRDGALVAVEVKTSPRDFDDDALRDLRDVATRVRAEAVVLAAFRASVPQMQGIARRFEALDTNRVFTIVPLAPPADVNDPVPRPDSGHWETPWF